MSPAGYSGTPLAKKLGIGEGDRVWLAGAPADLLEKLRPLPDDVTVASTGSTTPRGPGEGAELALPSAELPPARFDVVMLFCPHAEALRAHFAVAVDRLRWAGGLWACWPKKSSSLYLDLAREEVREVGLATGLVDNKVCAVDEDWSGLRFVVRKEDRPDSVEEGGPTG